MNNHSIATYKSITNHPTLASETKFAYLFPKTKRFNAKNPQQYKKLCRCPQAFYTYQSQLSQRKTGMGFGKKIDIFRKSQSPSATQYNIKSIFDNDSKGITFGCSRQKSPQRSYIIPEIQKNPGPGRYENQVETIMHQKFSIRSKTIDINNVKATCNFTPGPGNYESINLQNQNGRYKVSKYKDTKYAKIDPNCQRFPKIKQSPGPTTYQHHDGSMQEGNYTLSRHQGIGGRIFNKQARFTSSEWKPLKNPGPGKYVIPVEFGILK